MTDYCNLAEALAHARIRRGQNQTAAAKALKVACSTYNAWETRGCRPQTEHLEALSKYLGMTVIETLRLAGHGKPFKSRSKAAGPSK
jgi:transcriptional regulator with XRE-family HTH domain